jgi:hypothetical protein
LVLNQVQRPIFLREDFIMRAITGLSIAALAITAASAPAFGKAHLQPSDTAQQLGQANASAVMLDADGNVVEDPTGARNADARGLLDGDTGVDGQAFSAVRSASGGSERGMKAGEMTKPK